MRIGDSLDRPVLDIDPFSRESMDNPLALDAAIRAAGPVAWVPKYGFWITGRDKVVREVFEDWRRFSSAFGTGLTNVIRDEPWRKPSVILEADPPVHTPNRKVLARVLSPAALRRLADDFRAEAERMAERLDWVCGDAMALPFEDASFDVYTISFGIRNVTRIEDALAEAYRVLRPGGRLMVLEFSQLPVPALQWAYDRYSFNVIPAMGQLVTKDRDSYQYLVESIRKFPDQERFAAMIRAAGFERVKYRNLSFGIAALHSGWKL